MRGARLDIEESEAVVYAPLDLRFGESHLTRAERYLIIDGCAEELGVRILEQEADSLMEGLVKALVLETGMGNLFAVEEIGPGLGKNQSVEELQQRRLPDPLGPTRASASPRSIARSTWTRAGASA